MKNLFLKFGTIFILLSIAGNLMSQASIQTGTITWTSTSPTIDGVADEIWAEVEKFAIERTWPGQTISMKDGAAPTWQACWDEINTYVLITVPDDHQYDHIEAGVGSWLADKPELYFDINPNKVEDPAVGPSTIGLGHYQFASDFNWMEFPSTQYTVAFTIDSADAGYIFEYAIPHFSMYDIDGVAFEPNDGLVIGFDVTIVDLDAEGKGLNTSVGRSNWSNDMLTAGESWVDMTMSGDVTYSYVWICKCWEPDNADFYVSKTDLVIDESTQFTDLSNFGPTSWKWIFGDGTTSEIQNPTHSYNTLGFYTITLISSNESFTDTVVKENYINVNLTGIKNRATAKNVKLFPNPSAGIINLKVDKYLSSELSAQIIDARGRIVFTKHNIVELTEKIDLSNYPKGIYFIQLSGNNYLQTEKLIIY